VLYAGTAYQLAAIRLKADAGLSFQNFSAIHYPPVASVVLGFRREDLAHSCAGFGMLIPRIEGFKILGTIFSSSLFPNRAPAGHVTLTSYVGGERYPELASLPPESLYEVNLPGFAGVAGADRQAHVQALRVLSQSHPAVCGGLRKISGTNGPIWKRGRRACSWLAIIARAFRWATPSCRA